MTQQTTDRKPITITGTAPALVGKYTWFDPAEPANTRADAFSFIDPRYVNEDGILDAAWHEYRFVGWAEITITLLPHDDMLKSAVESLTAQKKKVMADSQAEITRIEGEIQKLLAINYERPSSTEVAA